MGTLERWGGYRMKNGRGFTLVEIMVSMTVISVAFLTVMTVIRSTSDNLGFELTVSDQQVITRSTVDRMMEELRLISHTYTTANFDVNNSSSYAQFTPADDPGPHSLTFGIPRYDDLTDTVTYGGTSDCITYRWVISEREIPGNNVDDDGNGLVDNEDGRIERVNREAGVVNDLQVVCDNVPQDGFEIRKIGRRLEITIARRNRTPRFTEEGTNFTTTVTQVTYCLKNE